MRLKLQIITLLFSFLFGIYFSFMIDISKKIILNKNKFIKIIFSFLIVFLNALLYFLILLKLNNAIIHPHFLIVFIVGFFVENYISTIMKRIVKFKKK